MGDGKSITDKVYIEWGKSLESIIEIGNKTMNILPVVAVTNGDVENEPESNVDEEAKEKKSEARMGRKRKLRRRM